MKNDIFTEMLYRCFQYITDDHCIFHMSKEYPFNIMFH